MNFYEDLNMEKIVQKSAKIINEITKKNEEKFNSFKSKHFNKFFYNIINEQLKLRFINNKININDINKSDSIIKNEYLHKTIKKKNILNQNINLKIHKNINLLHYDDYDNILPKTISKEIINKQQKKDFNIFYPDSKSDKNNNEIDSKKENKIILKNNKIYINKGQNTIRNTLNTLSYQSEKSKDKKKCSRNLSYSQNEYKTLLNENNSVYKTSDFNYIYKNRNQQLPKDAVNGLLLFLKKNKKHLAKTSKYYNIYKKYKEFIDNSDENLDNSKKNNKISSRNINIGYYGRKPLDGFDLYDITFTYRNRYSNKSEKNRHELMLAELNKLKGYINKNKNEKYLIIKDFLNKYNINYKNQKQLTSFENFINNFNKSRMNNVLKPYLGIKEMILDILKEGEKININNDCKDYNSNSSSSYNSPYSNIVNNNLQYNQYESNIYKSPFLIRQKYLYSGKINTLNKHRILKIPKFYSEKNSQNKKYNTSNTSKYKNNRINNKKIKSFDLFESNSYLKKIEKQKILFRPNKVYSSNYNLIIDEIGDEIEKLNTSIKYDKQYKITEYLLKQNKRKKNNEKNFNFITQSSNKSIEEVFITSNKILLPNNISTNKTLNEKINNNEVKSITKSNMSNFSMDKIRRNSKKKVNHKINKLNIKPKYNDIEIEDIRKRLKLTEYIVLSNAKKKLMFQNLGKNELYECVNSININKK